MNYEEYLKRANDTLTFEEANRIFNAIQTGVDAFDEDASELYRDWLEAAFAYASVRSSWLQLSKEKKMELDSGRTAKHDTVIVRINVLSRYLGSIGKDVSWRDELGDSRKRIGDFACYVALVYGLNAR